ncbi:phosphoribosylglycinamide formyltransferase [Paramagnetospirillum magneticum]|uniref:Phosphoribosylglycinamide formyltransferase n=1 Tax=Paramagnetospirillum magneticum (strain ATCC 700264 / AMB-1) TaxID=342108 RepID=Q2W3C4_PARM1|nr:phosphoribosylglycinamide formyltransferase [Paramagnetospirillum magneticum]BAE51651.1 Folate-dependent phosphoribosylglycinamide formyltransferase PurN [Paramagnetospirillum magneticum AMB-1]
MKKKVGVLVSGRGSNLQALLDACADPSFPAEIALVISNVPGVYALERAAKAGVPTLTIPHKGFPSREAFDAEMDKALRAAGIEIVCLAGFMRLLSTPFAEGWRGRMINIHPALLPSFKGLHTHARAIEAGVKLHGCTVHLVTPELDDGPILVQKAVPVLAQDDEDSLAARVLEQEHKAYPEALRLLAEGRVVVEGNRALIRDA